MERILSLSIGLIAILSILFCTQQVTGQEKEDSERTMVLKQVKLLLKESDTFKAIEFVNSQGEPQTVAKKYSDLVKDLYWKEHAISDVVTIARAGIQYCLTKAQELANDDPEEAVQLKRMARVISYNLASFTWPGWDEKDIVISQSDLSFGLDAAKLNLRLVNELNEEPIRFSIAYWVLGAQYMAARENDKATDAFVSSMERAKEANDKASELLALGYIGVGKIVKGEKKAEGQKQLDEAIEGLNKLDTEDSKFFIEQLKTALKIFTK
jgi:hypothetical protein